MKSKSFRLIIVLAMVLGLSGLGSSRAADCETISILALDTSTFDSQILGYLTGTTYLEVSPSDFAAVDLTAYDVLYVGSAFQNSSVTIPSQAALNALNARQADIADFVYLGGGLVALSEPIGIGCYTWLPISATPSGRTDRNTISIFDSTHPVMSGLTNAGLSGWGVSSHNVFIDVGSYSVLATAFGTPVTLAGSYGSGRIVLTGQDPDFHYFINPYPGKQYIDFLQNAINWVGEVVCADIDIKPGSFPNAINKNGKGVIPVAILGSEDFDVNQIDLYTLNFQGLEVRIKGNDEPQCSIQDVSGPEGIPDGFDDLVCQFVDNPDTWLVGDGEATLTGQLLDGTRFEGTDSIIVVQ